jgi:PAS domain S-box-containing protein
MAGEVIMSKIMFGIDDVLKNELQELKNVDFVEVDETVLNILNCYKAMIEKQQRSLESLSKYKERELDAFAIGDAVSDGICLVDNSGVVTAINKGYTEITEIKEEEIVGKHIQEAVKEGYFNNAVSLLVIEQKKKITSLATINQNNKKVLITGNPVFDEKGQVTQVLTVMRDLTELLKLRDKIERTER